MFSIYIVIIASLNYSDDVNACLKNIHYNAGENYCSQLSVPSVLKNYICMSVKYELQYTINTTECY